MLFILLKGYHVPGTTLGIGNAAVNKTGKKVCIHAAYNSRGGAEQ